MFSVCAIVSSLSGLPVLMLSLIPPFLDYDFGDIFPVLQPSADWEGGTWLPVPYPPSLSVSVLTSPATPLPVSQHHACPPSHCVC